jgi:class 3 adenylate cyclase/pimeloyl-ACP methyl ester carboxylesterase
MEQEIRFATASDGVSIAYCVVGEGPPLVYVCGWPQHLELDWESPLSRGFLEEIAGAFTLIRYDMRGSGLSDRKVSDFSLDALTRDLAAVVDQLALEKFALLSLGTLSAPISIHYAAEHPGRVSHLFLLSSYLRGEAIVPPDRRRVLVEYAATFGIPISELGGEPFLDRDEDTHVRKIQKAAVEPEVQGALLNTMFSADVTDEARRVDVPALVMHARGDPMMPFELGREVASHLPQASFVPFEASSPAVWRIQGIILPELRRFLGVAAAPAPAPHEDHAHHDIHTILFTDIEGSTALNERLGDAKGRELLREHERIVRESLKAHGGAEVKTMGDGFMASFPSATRALECAVTMQRAFARRNEDAAEPIRVRIGLNAGEPIAERGESGQSDLFGSAVNLAARVAASAHAGEILVADVVRQLAAGKGFLFSDRGETVMRGFEDPVRIHELRWRED